MKRQDSRSKRPLGEQNWALATVPKLRIPPAFSEPQLSERLAHEGLDLEYEWWQGMLEIADSSLWARLIQPLLGFLRTGKGFFALLPENGAVVKVRGAAAWAAYFSFVSATSSYLLISKERVAHFSEQKTAQEAAAETTESFLLIAHQTPFRRLRQLPWTRQNGLSEDSLKDSVSLLTSRSSYFQHDLCTYRYAGRLRKSSFSPYLPYSSVLARRVPQSKQLPQNDVQEIVGACVALMQRRAGVLEGMTLVLGEVAPARIFLIGVARPVWRKERKSTMPPLPAPLQDLSEAQSPVKLHKSLSEAFTRPLAKVPYIDTSEIQTQNIRLYKQIVAQSVSLDHRVPDAPCFAMARSLTSIAEKLDQQKRQLHVCRMASQTGQLLDQELRDLARKAYHKCLKDDILGRFFPGTSEEACPHLSRQFEQALITQEKYYLSMKIRKIHSNLGISSDAFQRFVRLFHETMRENGVAESSQDIVVAHLHWYEPYIASSSLSIGT